MKKALAVFLAPLLTVLAFVSFYAPAPTTGQANIPCYRQQGGAKTVAGSGCEYEFQSGSTIDVQSGVTFGAVDLTVSDDLTVTDDVFVGDDLNVADIIGSTFTTITLGYAGTITPTGVYQQLTAAAARGTSSVANPTAGRLVVLINVGSNTITLTDTGTLKLSGNIALGQYDSLTMVGDGTNWIQLATTNN